MEIKGKVHCFFEQSGTFKNEFIKLGIPAEDYDIQNNFGETDHTDDLFKAIEDAYDGKTSLFDNITSDDLIMAFFPCIFFCQASQSAFTYTYNNYSNYDIKKKTESILERSKNREYFYTLLIKLFGLVRKLTEGECLRLMDVPEEMVHKLRTTTQKEYWGKGKDVPVLAKTALYKLAGNSIVVSCLREIFENIYLTEDDPEEMFDLFPEPTFRVEIPKKIKMVTLCSGYDSQMIALSQLVGKAKEQGYETECELMAWSEFDPENKASLEKQPAVIAHNILFPEYKDRNVGDMTKADWSFLKDADIDILTYSTPCQSISQAGKREGIEKDSGTRSAILWYTENAIRTMRPKFLLQENVAALANEVNMPHFKQWQEVCRDCGYDNYWALMNAKDHGIAQNRLRVFMLSVRRDLNLPRYRFPKPYKLETTIADVLEEDVDRSYFLSEENVIKYFERDPDGSIYVTTDHKFTNEELEDVYSQALSAQTAAS